MKRIKEHLIELKAGHEPGEDPSGLIEKILALKSGRPSRDRWLINELVSYIEKDKPITRIHIYDKLIGVVDHYHFFDRMDQ